MHIQQTVYNTYIHTYIQCNTNTKWVRVIKSNCGETRVELRCAHMIVCLDTFPVVVVETLRHK